MWNPVRLFFRLVVWWIINGTERDFTRRAQQIHLLRVMTWVSDIECVLQNNYYRLKWVVGVARPVWVTSDRVRRRTHVTCCIYMCAHASQISPTLPKCYYLTERYLWFWTLALNCRDNILKWNTARSPNKLHVSTLKVPRSRERPRDRRCCRHLVVHPHTTGLPQLHTSISTSSKNFW